MTGTEKEIYVTTAIPYVNGAPHIGHAMDYLLADVYVRYQRLRGRRVRLQAGTDEHGNKVYKKAVASGLTPEEFAGRQSREFQEFIRKLGVRPTDFIRTTDAAHVRRVQEIWQKLAPHIYQDTYEGWYCEGCEGFVTQGEYDENGGVCPDHQTPYQRLSEQNYYLRIADFKEEIRAAIESGRMRILPEFRKREALSLLERAPDVSISRPAAHLKWGVPVPGDESQVMYVWLDALANYITVLGYPEREIARDWPADVQIVGKDILRFHAITWPAILLGLGLELPRVLLSHGHVLAGGQKMSKSLGNVVDPVEVIERHGLPAFRYFFSRHIDTFADSDFTWEKFDRAYANELANDLGNLVQRLASLCEKNGVGSVGRGSVGGDFEVGAESGGEVRAESGDEDSREGTLSVGGVGEELGAGASDDAEYLALMDQFEFSKAIDYAWGKLQDLNRRIDETKPWALAKTGTAAEVTALLQSLVADLLAANRMLAPFLPETAETIAGIFTGEGVIRAPEVPLFPKG